MGEKETARMEAFSDSVFAVGLQLSLRAVEETSLYISLHASVPLAHPFF
jgi:hypothetical protein